MELLNILFRFSTLGVCIYLIYLSDKRVGQLLDAGRHVTSDANKAEIEAIKKRISELSIKIGFKDNFK